jgi:hypothetical protein
MPPHVPFLDVCADQGIFSTVWEGLQMMEDGVRECSERNDHYFAVLATVQIYAVCRHFGEEHLKEWRHVVSADISAE